MPSDTTHSSNSPETGLREAVEHMERIRGPEHADVAWPLMALADYLRGTGRWEEALQLYTRALRIREEALGEQHLEVAKVYNAIGSLHRARGLYVDAEPFFRHALEIRQRIAGKRSELAAASLNNLGALYHSLGRYREADQLVREALQIRESIYGASDSRLASCVTNLAVVQGDLGDYRAARDTAERSLALRSGTVPPDDVERALSLIVLSGALDRLGEWQESERLARQALAIRQKQLGAAHSSVAGAQLALAEVMLNTGRPGEALAAASEALEIRRAQLPAPHPDITQAEVVVARAMAAGSMKEEAAAQLEHLAAAAGNPDHVGHPFAASIWLALAVARGDAHEAMAAARTALSIRERLLGPAHPASAEAATLVAHQEVRRGELDCACDRLPRAIEVLVGVLPEGHPTLRSARADLALCMINSGELVRAAAELRLADRRLAGAPPSLEADAAVEAMREQCLSQPSAAEPGSAVPLWSEPPAPDVPSIPFDMPDPYRGKYSPDSLAYELSHPAVDSRTAPPSYESPAPTPGADRVELGDEIEEQVSDVPSSGGGVQATEYALGFGTVRQHDEPQPTPANDGGDVEEPQETEFTATDPDTQLPESSQAVPYPLASDPESAAGGTQEREDIAIPAESPFSTTTGGPVNEETAERTADAVAPEHSPPVERESFDTGPVQGAPGPAAMWQKSRADEPEPAQESMGAAAGHSPDRFGKSLAWPGDESLNAEDAETARMVEDGDLSGADARIADLVRRRTTRSGANSPDAADAMLLMGRLRSAQGRHEEAASLFRHSLAIHRSCAAPDDGAVASALSRLAGELARVDTPAAVRELVDAELKRLQRRYGTESRQYAVRAQNLAILCEAVGAPQRE